MAQTVHPEPPYVPPNLRDSKHFDAFNQELLNAVTCCVAVELEQFNNVGALEIVNKARRKNPNVTVKAVSLPSEPSSGCLQRFMAFKAKFKAKDDGKITAYILAFRSDRECYSDMVSKSGGSIDGLEDDNNFHVHKSLWWRAAATPLRSLPPEWQSGLRFHRHRLILTGFSVGGSVAALATFQLLEAEDPVIRQQICCYTFGAPLQGDQNYANCINQKYVTNFYHVMINGDPIPGILTLLSKVADNERKICQDVATSIFRLLTTATQVATSVAVQIAAPGAGSILQHIDFTKLGSLITNLIVTERNSNMPLPEYKFGGSLVLLDVKHPHKMCFVQLLRDGRVLQDVFRVQERTVTSSNLKNLQSVFQLKMFSEVINDMSNSHLIPAIVKSESVHDTDPKSTEIVRSHEKFDGAMDRAVDRANFVANSATNAFKSAASTASRLNCHDPKNLGHNEGAPKTPKTRPFLQPKFDDSTPMRVWLDKHENITVEVYGENMVLGVHVLYLIDGKEQLRVPCTERNVLPQYQDDDDSKNSQKSMAQAYSNLPLQFRTHGTKGLSFEELGGCYKIQLAFGFHVVDASKVKPRMFDSLDALRVAERFSIEPPTKLIDLLVFLGTATAQAQCTAAYYAIDKDKDNADKIVQETLDKLRDVPPEFVHLDKLLRLIDTSQLPPSTLDKLPPEMKQTFIETTKNSQASKSTCIVPYFAADNESASWTFGGCYTRTIQSMLTKEMLSKKETAEQLAANLEKVLDDAPKQVLIAYLNHGLEYKSYARDYSFGSIKTWNREKQIVYDGAYYATMGGGSLPLVTVPIYWIAKLIKLRALEYVAKAIGLPTAAIVGGLFGGGYVIYHGCTLPFRMIWNKPSVIADLMRETLLADNWEKKLQSAVFLFNCKIDLPHVVCKLEHQLYCRLKETSAWKDPKVGCYNSSESLLSETKVKEARHEVVTALKLANLGLAGARMYDIRRYLTDRQTALGLIGTSQAGKSTFAKLAFGVDSKPGSGMDSRTRVLRNWTVPFPENRIRNREFTLIDFPGSTDQAAPHWYIRGQLLASVLVVVLPLDEMSTVQAIDLVKKACEVRRKDKKVSIIICFTHADQKYEKYEDEALDIGGDTTAAHLFTKNFNLYKEQLLEKVSEPPDQVNDERFQMHACCFRPQLQDKSKPRARELDALEVKNVDFVKNWCLNRLLDQN